MFEDENRKKIIIGAAILLAIVILVFYILPLFFKKDDISKILPSEIVLNEEEQKQKINNLNAQLRKQKNTNKELTAFIEKLQTRISEQEEEIQLLTTELQKHKIVIENLNRNLDELNKQNQDKDERILKIEEEKNTAYYVIGEKKELLEKGIINRKGGFLGMGKRSVASSDSELANYTKIDIRRVPEIRLHGTKIKILTSHPSESYRSEPDTKRPTRLVITNPSLFWQKSKFLVIELD